MGLFDLFKKKAETKQINCAQQTVSKAFTPNAQHPIIKVTAEIIPLTPDEVIPVETRVRTAIKSKSGLYPHEVLILDYAQTFYTDQTSFQGFWWYKYGIRNVEDCLKSLYDRGFLKTGSLQTAIEKENGSALKEVLKTSGLKVSGKKGELVQRLLNEVPHHELNKRFAKRTYELTEVGKQALAEEGYIPYIHRHAIEDLDIWTLNKIVHKQPYMPYRDRIWAYLNQRSLEHIQAYNFGLYRNCRSSMYTFLTEENKWDNALSMIAEVIYYDLSGLSNGFQMRYLSIYAEGFFPYKESTATIAPGITQRLLECQKQLGLTDDALHEQLVLRMERFSAPFHLFTVEECADIALMETKEDTEALTKMYVKAKRRYNQAYPKTDL